VHPIITREAGLTAAQGSLLATANYLGYLAGALLSIVIPRVLRSRMVYLTSLLSVVAAIGLMATARDFTAWFALRFIVGLTCALVFVIVSSAMLSRFRQEGQYLVGWGFGGIGAGIALCPACSCWLCGPAGPGGPPGSRRRCSRWP
jgi:MFS family permease